MNTPVKSKGLDRIDISILDTLQRDGRIANVDLAKKVNLSASPCIDRVKRLEKEGYIDGFGARLNAAKLGFGTAAFIQVTLDRTTSEVFDKFRDAVVQIPQVAECHNITGTVEYLLRVETRDLASYKHFHTEVLGTLPQVNAITSYIVMGSPKDERA